jgi:hypothetical protein
MTGDAVASDLRTTREPLVRRIPWYPVVLTATFVLNLFVESGNSPYAVLRPLIVSTGVAMLLTAICVGLTRSRYRGAAVAGAIVVAMAGWRQPILLLIGVVAFVVVVLILPRTRWSAGLTWPAVTRLLNVASLVLLLGIGLKMVQVGTLGSIGADIQQGHPLPAAPAVGPATGPPDIYLILLDARPRSDLVGNVLGGDPEAFGRALTQRGFDVVENSAANYNFTELTLASMLDMRLLDDIPSVEPHLGSQDRDQPLLRDTINHGAALSFLRERGYEIVATTSGFDGVALRQADVYLDSGELSELEVAMIRATPIGWLLDRLGADVVGDQVRSRVGHAFDFLHDLAVTPASKPRFALVHIPAPHAPLVFGPGGAPVAASFDDPFAFPDRSSGDQTSFIETYRGGLEYLDGQTIKAIDDLLTAAAAGRDPVIVVFGDHGPRTGLAGSPAEQRAEQLADFVAIRAPGHANLFGETTSLVNVLPTLFNALFDTDLPRSPDRSFLTPGDHLFELTEVPRPIASQEP